MSLLSLLTGSSVKSNVAMTGEITLRGRVLPVGGIKEKVLAAHRAGIKRIVMPFRNEKDLEEIPEDIRKDLEFRFVQRMGEVLALVLQDMQKDRTVVTAPVEKQESHPQAI